MEERYRVGISDLTTYIRDIDTHTHFKETENTIKLAKVPNYSHNIVKSII